MTWQILWALILGFTLSAVVQAVVRRATVVRLLGDGSPRALAAATVLGIASSSCSYAAVALARSLFRKGASFTAAMVFEIASTNLVVELGILLALLMGWQFTAAEFVGGPVMIVLIAVLYRVFLRRRLLSDALRHADPQHLPEVLRLADGRVRRGHLLRHHGPRRVRRRTDLRRASAGSRAPQRDRARTAYRVELHHVVEPRLPGAGRGTGHPVRRQWCLTDAADDGRFGRSGPPPFVPAGPVAGRSGNPTGVLPRFGRGGSCRPVVFIPGRAPRHHLRPTVVSGGTKDDPSTCPSVGGRVRGGCVDSHRRRSGHGRRPARVGPARVSLVQWQHPYQYRPHRGEYHRLGDLHRPGHPQPHHRHPHQCCGVRGDPPVAGATPPSGTGPRVRTGRGGDGGVLGARQCRYRRDHRELV